MSEISKAARLECGEVSIAMGGNPKKAGKEPSIRKEDSPGGAYFHQCAREAKGNCDRVRRTAWEAERFVHAWEPCMVIRHTSDLGAHVSRMSS